jgi:hypothetical protein
MSPFWEILVECADCSVQVIKRFLQVFNFQAFPLLPGSTNCATFIILCNFLIHSHFLLDLIEMTK